MACIALVIEENNDIEIMGRVPRLIPLCLCIEHAAPGKIGSCEYCRFLQTGCVLLWVENINIMARTPVSVHGFRFSLDDINIPDLAMFCVIAGGNHH